MVTAVMVGDALEEEMDEDVRRELPKHRRCGAHTVNLMATTDVSKVSLYQIFNFKLVYLHLMEIFKINNKLII